MMPSLSCTDISISSCFSLGPVVGEVDVTSGDQFEELINSVWEPVPTGSDSMTFHVAQGLNENCLQKVVKIVHCVYISLFFR